MHKELRCRTKLHGILTSPAVLEIKCNSRYCGAIPGRLVFHRFDIESGELIETLWIKDAGYRKPENNEKRKVG